MGWGLKVELYVVALPVRSSAELDRGKLWNSLTRAFCNVMPGLQYFN